MHVFQSNSNFCISVVIVHRSDLPFHSAMNVVYRELLCGLALKSEQHIRDRRFMRGKAAHRNHTASLEHRQKISRGAAMDVARRGLGVEGKKNGISWLP